MEPRYNIAPSQLIACVRVNPTSQEKECVQFQWGLVPSWAKELSLGHRLIHAQAETVAEKPSFRKVFQQQRCLILADGFYEWKRIGTETQPCYIHLKENRPFVFAGIWDHWEILHQGSLDSCSIITIGCNPLMESIHHRMPVILSPGQDDVWLDPVVQDFDHLHSLLEPYPINAMESFPVCSLVNNPRNENPLCLRSMI